MNPDPSDDLKALFQELTATNYPARLSEFDVAQYLAGMMSVEDKAHFESVMESNPAFRDEITTRQAEHEALFTPERLEAYEKAIFRALKLPQPSSEQEGEIERESSREPSTQDPENVITPNTFQGRENEDFVYTEPLRLRAGEKEEPQLLDISRLLPGFFVWAMPNHDDPVQMTTIEVSVSGQAQDKPPRPIQAKWLGNCSKPVPFEYSPQGKFWISRIHIRLKWADAIEIIKHAKLNLESSET